ncbi:MAG: hypothetical protein LBS96_05650, partial [Oscillospiraceae bacterium]|nr:hypothetical protein [Oscillospiraceae bacterium]
FFAACQRNAITTAVSTSAATVIETTTQATTLSAVSSSEPTILTTIASSSLQATKASAKTTVKLKTTATTLKPETQITPFTTRAFPETMNAEMEKNKQILLQNIEMYEGDAEIAAKRLYTRGIAEIKEITVEAKPYPPPMPQDQNWLFIRIVDVENEVYTLEATLDGGIALIYKGEGDDRRSIYAFDMEGREKR